MRARSGVLARLSPVRQRAPRRKHLQHAVHGSTPSGRWRAKGRAPSSSALGARQTEYLRDQDVRRARREVRLAAALPARTKISFCKLNPSPMRTSYSKNRCRVDSRASEQSFAATSHTTAIIIGDGRRSRMSNSCLPRAKRVDFVYRGAQTTRAPTLGIRNSELGIRNQGEDAQGDIRL